MGYKNLVAEPVASRSETFKKVRDWMCKRNGSYDYSVSGLGWTLHDSVYAVNQDTISANDYFVMYSAGESGKEDLYVKVLYSATSNFIQITIHQYWTASTHVGVNSASAANNWYVLDATAGSLYIYADLDSCFVGVYQGASKYGTTFGLVNAFYDRTVAVSAGAVSAGSNKVVTLDAVPPSWVVGGRVMVRDNANMEIVTISNISGLTVTFATVVASYAAGCKFAKDYPVICTNNLNLYNSYVSLLSHAGAKQPTYAYLAPSAIPGTSGDPDPLDGEWLVTSWHIQDATGGYIGTIRNIYVCNAAFTDLTVYSIPGGANYRAFNSFNSAVSILCREV